jgi:tRNA threonylcarbamoyladenosine biosynthesis protein TsaB
VILLAVDTSAERGGIALWRDGRVAEKTLEAPDGFSHILFAEIERFLAEQGVTPGEIDAFAAASGPGSFTGVRVALSAMKGLAEVFGRPLFAVSNLQALAWYGSGGLRAPVLDARRGEIYGGLYDAELNLAGEEVAVSREAFEAALPPGTEAIEQRDSVAAAVARIAAARYLAGERPEPAAADANYVRRSDAELKWTDPAA